MEIRTYEPNKQYTFMVIFKDHTTNETFHWVWITELEDLWDTTKMIEYDKEYTLKMIVEKGIGKININDIENYYQGQNTSNGNNYLIDCINENLEHSQDCGECMKDHNIEIISITDIRD